ncbi:MULTISPECIES: AI-2E family transporter [Subtercola]|uniref:AI-2E family transporter n=1 Tax=Subtercola vilae TaxID=2056433 RepID=A0A4T2C6Y4_9MICO|nr:MULTISPECIES: AI-2E family transporter [Subtercola]MEA9986292.1 AI-2E family transporter [Subtercola sp. RTI3]TIH38276.1 AI-2E family transporter [Subtercola vilae]
MSILKKRAEVPSPAKVSPEVQVVSQGSEAFAQVNAFKIGLLGALGVLVALVIGGLITQLGTVLIYVGVALFIALGLDPLVSRLSRRMPRPLAIGIVFGIVVVILAALLLTIIPIIVSQTTNLVNNFPSYITTLQGEQWVKDLEQQLSGVVSVDDVIKNVQSFLSPDKILSVGGGLLAVGAGVASGVTGSVIVLILTLYFLASIRSMKRVVYRFVPATKRSGFAEITEQITQAVGRYVVGQIALALVNGILSFVFLTVIGAPLPVLLAFIAFLLSLVPLVGTVTGSVIIVLISLFASPATAIAAAIYYLVYMQVEAYVLSPRIMNRAVSVPGAVVVIGAVAGGTIGGVLGALVAIPIAASAIIVIEKVVFPKQDAK